MVKHLSRHALVLVVALVAGLSGDAFAKPSWEGFMSRGIIGADDFMKQHPTWDGRGVVIAVFDTGIELDNPGLATTSDGKQKIIGARDCSGQGDIKISQAEEVTVDGVTTLKTGSAWVKGFEKLEHKPNDGRYYLGTFSESALKNSEVKDLNGNGKTSDSFALLTFFSLKGGKDGKEGWVVYPDTNGDGSVADEKPVREFDDTYDTFVFGGADPMKKVAPLVFSVHVDPGQRINLHFADGSHGTHVAGITAGHSIYGQEGFDGIAPGAQLLSVKIGNNTLAGGSTTTGSVKKAFDYVAQFAKQHGVPVVINMSYGIGSEIEGSSAIDKYADDFLAKHPELVMASSCGNAGPGLSTAGTPAAANLVFAAGAVLPKKGAKSLYGVDLDADKLFVFTSRGGEVAKPDGVAPGVALSTVPKWEEWEIFRGTSMASPQVAGAMALVLSGLKAKNPDAPYTNGMVNRAFRATAKPMKGYTILDQGPGLINVPKAFQTLEKMSKDKKNDLLLDYEISTYCPTLPGGRCEASYWRTGTYIPKKPHLVSITVKPLFRKTASAKEIEDFYTAFELDTTQGWIDIDKDAGYIKGKESFSFMVTYDPGKMKKPGLYTGAIVAYDKGKSGDPEGLAFVVPQSIIVPHTFSMDNDYGLVEKNKTIKIGDVTRTFVAVPAGATLMSVELLPKGNPGYAKLYVFDPDGHRILVEDSVLDTDTGEMAHADIDKQLLTPGVWEIVVYGDYKGKLAKTKYDLAVQFYGLDLKIDYDYDSLPGEKPGGGLQVTQAFEQDFYGYANATYKGMTTEFSEMVSGSQAYEYAFSMDDTVDKINFRLELAPEDYNKLTDCAVNVVSPSGKALWQGGFSQRIVYVSFKNPYPGDKKSRVYSLQINAGMAHEGDEMLVKGTEWVYMAKPLTMTIKKNGYSTFALYPGVPTDLSYSVESMLPDAPETWAQFAEVELIDTRTKKPWGHWTLSWY